MASYNPISDHPPLSPQSHDEENEDEEKGEEDYKAKFTADEPQTDKPSSVSAATTGMAWSDEQVTKLLQCMIEFKAKKGVDADADPAAFHQFFEQKFQFRYSKSRVYEKVRRLKMKYCNNLKKFEIVEKKTGISKAELQTLNLSRQISVGSAGAGDFESNYPLLNQSFEVESRGVMKFGGKTADELSFLKENMHLIGDDKAKELERKWKTLHAVHFFKSLELMKEQISLVLEATIGKK
ncbi:STOREKEEPER protein-like [Coffea arabica]|uniref:STOREKEEPER protein-like n=1 Tax=Coffea arabica TaxID=13443 RepID=A0A6P6TEJ9_COFAR|nr:STOREKEEPER protein-like [Coffea arabica]